MKSFGFISRNLQSDGAVWDAEDRLIPIMRIALSLSAQLVVLAHPEESISGSMLLTSSVHSLYVIYAIWLFIRTRREDRISMVLHAWAHWIDVAWCLGFMFVSRGAGSSYFIGLLFPIVVASFRWGLVSALRVTVVSVFGYVAFSGVSLLTHLNRVDIKLVIARSLWLLLVGYLLGYWGELEIRIRRRFDLIGRLTGYANPRFGVNRTLAFILERLRDFYQAHSSLMLLADSDGNGFRMLRTGGRQEDGAARFSEVAPELARRLLELSPEYAAVHNARCEEWWRFGICNQVMDIAIGRSKKAEPFDSLAGILDAASFVTVPVHYRSQGIGRLYVVAESPVFVPSDMRFLLQVLEHVNPIMENVRLIEQLAAHAADEERRKIARDIHDSVIQPYLGLQMGLAGLREETVGAFPAISRKIDKLMELTASGVNDLRLYVRGLKEEEDGGGMVPAMRRFAATFSEATGIAVEIETEGDLHANERLAAEVFQMMTEGLSNIRKHTQAVRAKVRVICRLGHLILEIRNESSRGPVPFFTPSSIMERAAAMGGKVRVRNLAGEGSTVIVDIPL